MLVGVVDVGSNTVRLLVAKRRKSGVCRVHEEREQLGLGEDVELPGRISERKLARAETIARRAGRARAGRSAARASTCSSPRRAARPGTARQLRAALERGSGLPARESSPPRRRRDSPTRARCRRAGPRRRQRRGRRRGRRLGAARRGHPRERARLDALGRLGSLRLTRRLLVSDPPTRDAARGGAGRGRALLRRGHAAAAAGGARRGRQRTRAQARGRAAAAGRRATSRRRCASWPSGTVRETARRHGLAPERARTLAAGALILAEAQRRLGLPLEVARGGLREGAALALLSERAAA